MVDKQEYLEKIFRELYYVEHDRKARINTDRSIPIAILTVVTGVLAYYAQNFPSSEFELFFLLFIFFCGCALFSIVRSIIFLKKTFFKYNYDYVISPQEMDDLTSELRDYYNQIGAKDIEDAIIEDMQKLIINQYKESTNNNIKSNNKKQFDVTLSLKWLYRAIVFIIISMLPFYIIYHTSDYIQKVELIKNNNGVQNGRK